MSSGIHQVPNAQKAKERPAARIIYVTNAFDGTVWMIDEATNAVTHTIRVGNGPVGVAVDPAARTACITNWYSHMVSVIDESTNSVTAAVPVHFVIGVAVDPATHTAYVTSPSSGTVSVQMCP
ncbi:MAG TPA: YncE family protein [Streptosporangiaceae bacterium]|jgi:YVTN family beta-propeller protein